MVHMFIEILENRMTPNGTYVEYFNAKHAG